MERLVDHDGHVQSMSRNESASVARARACARASALLGVARQTCNVVDVLRPADLLDLAPPYGDPRKRIGGLLLELIEAGP